MQNKTQKLVERQQEMKCDRNISLLIEPCFCKYIVRIKPATGSDVDHIRLQSIWLNCDDRTLNDDRISYILNIFVSDEINRNFTRRIDLRNIPLTKIPSEIYRFRRLNKILILNTNITSIPRSDVGIFNNATASTAITRLIRLNLRRNKINQIDAGVFEGN